MIIKIIASALIQCMTLTQAGWITFAGTVIGWSSAAARLDTAVLRPSIPFRVMHYTLENQGSLRPCTMKSMQGLDRGHKKASRVIPRLAMLLPLVGDQRN